MVLGNQSVDLNQKSRGSLHDSGKAAGVVAQQLALPVDEVDASASVAGDSLVIVLGRIFIVVQPVLDLHLSVRTGEKQRRHRRHRNAIKEEAAQLQAALCESEKEHVQYQYHT